MTIVPPGALTLMGVLFPSSVLRSELFGVLAAFVAVNTMIYTALAVAKMLPKLYLSDWVSHRNRRSETRSIHPDVDTSEPGGDSRPPFAQ